MTNQHTDHGEPGGWYAVPEAAARLGIGENAVRSRVKRRSLRSRRTNGGTLQIFVPEGTNPVRTTTEPAHRTSVRTKPGDALTALADAHARAMEVVTAAHAGEVEALRAALEEAKRRADVAEAALRAAQTQTGMLTWFLDVFRRTKPG